MTRLIARTLIVPMTTVILIAGCGGPPTDPQTAKQSAVTKMEKMHSALMEEINAGKIPSDSRRLPREAGVLAASAQGTPAADAAAKLQKQVADFEDMIDAQKKPSIDAVKKLVQEMGASISELKSKLEPSK